jgi:hypothetical protein
VAFLVGDSHASNHIVSIHAALGDVGAFEVRYATVGHGCGFTHEGGVRLNVDDRCAELHALISASLATYVQPGDMLVTSTHTTWGAALVDNGVHHEPFLEATASFLASRNASLVLLGDTPTVSPTGAQCVEQLSGAFAYKAACDEVGERTPLANYGALQSFDEMYARVARGAANNTYAVSLLELFCDHATGCGPSIPGTCTIGIADASHLTFEGSMYLAPFIHCFFEENGLLV